MMVHQRKPRAHYARSCARVCMGARRSSKTKASLLLCAHTREAVRPVVCLACAHAHARVREGFEMISKTMNGVLATRQPVRNHIHAQRVSSGLRGMWALRYTCRAGIQQQTRQQEDSMQAKVCEVVSGEPARQCRQPAVKQRRVPGSGRLWLCEEHDQSMAVA